MVARRVPVRGMLVGVALLGLAGLALARLRARDTVASAPPAAAPPPAPLRAAPRGRLLAVLAAASLLVAGVAFSAERRELLAEQAAPAQAVAPARDRSVREPVAHARRVPKPRSRPLPAPARAAEAVARLARRLLENRRVSLSPAGRADIAAGRVDVRLLALIEYLADAHGQVAVGSLVTGHRRFSRPGVVSRHVYGRAADIRALGGVPIAGNQQPGGLAERAVRELLALPPAVRPSQVISLLALGGPSWAQPDHEDHIHLAY